MKNYRRIIAALLLAASLVISALPFAPYTEVEAADTLLVYSTESNSGTRHVLCTTLEGTDADKYYTGSCTYDNLIKLSGDDLFDTLQALMISTHKKISSYDDCRDMAHKTDCENGDGRINLIYSSKSVTADSYEGGNGWNREYVWPKLLGADTKVGGGADLHHIRPVDNTLNNKRSNLKYGNVNGGTAATGSSLVGNYIGGYYDDYCFEPNDNVKGDVARICLYMYVRWNSDWDCDELEKVFESVDVLLEWCALDPVDTWEMGRNEVVAAYQGNRNVFIDYPELAWLIFDRDIPDDMTTPSGSANSNDPFCHHTVTEVRNVLTANCGYDGYTGDTYCASCDKKISGGTVVTASGDHEYGSWENSETHHWQECSVCKKSSAEESHSFDNSCDPSCNVCEYTRPITHIYGTDWENDDAEHWRICTVCNGSEAKSEHAYRHACDTVCNICDHVREIAHSFRSQWSGDETDHWHACSVCGLPDEKLPHVYTDANDSSCNTCGNKRQVVTAPSATKPSTTAPSMTAPSTTVPSTTPDPTSSAETSKVGETTGETNGGHKSGTDTGVIALCMFSALGGALICGAAVAIVSKKKS